MSNRFAKVLMVCSLVVLIPLLIAGTIIGVYFSKNSSVNVEIYTNVVSGSVGNPSIGSDNAAVEYDTEKDTYVITNGHRKDSVISASSVEGLKFVGWYEGTKDQYLEALASSTQPTVKEGINLTFKTGDKTAYTAVYNVYKYTISYHYDANPADGSLENFITDKPEGFAAHGDEYEYGEALPVLTLANDGRDQTDSTKIHYFMGWEIEEGNGKVYDKVTFPSDTLTLVLRANWENSKTIRREITVTSENGNYSYGEGKTKIEYQDSLAAIQELYTAENWTVTSKYANVFELKSIKFNETECETAQKLYDEISKVKDQKIELTANFDCIFTTIAVNSGVRVAVIKDSVYVSPYDKDGMSEGTLNVIDNNDGFIYSYNYTVNTNGKIFEATGTDNANKTDTIKSLFVYDLVDENDDDDYAYFADAEATQRVYKSAIALKYTLGGEQVGNEIKVTLDELGEDQSIYNFLSIVVRKLTENEHIEVDFTVDAFTIENFVLIYA